jgi:hypothetical protein
MEVVVAVFAEDGLHGGTGIFEAPLGGDAFGFFEHIGAESNLVVGSTGGGFTGDVGHG